MSNKQEKSSTMLWLMPTAILLIAIVIMFIDFYTTSSEAAQNQVEKNFVAVTESYASKVRERLNSIQRTGKTIAMVMENHSYKELGLAEETVQALHSQTDAYTVIMANMDGRGVNQDKEWVSLTETDYFEKIKDGTEQFLFLENDGMSGQTAVLCVLPIYRTQGENPDIGGMLLMYYPIGEFDNVIKYGEFEGNAFYLLVDSKGKIMESTAGGGTILNSTELWDMIPDADMQSRVRVRMENGNNDIIKVKDGTTEYRLVYEPIGINDWYMAVGIKENYAVLIQNRSWDNTKNMLIKLVAIVGVFLGIVIVLNTISKIRSNEKNKKLEDKADTDLLTGLNNKLATERKIKEYMSSYPNSQALLFLLDIDNFKKINDTMGHAFGDEVISAIGHGIRGEFRISDVIGRIGGDEFMVFLKDVNNDALIEEESQRVIRFFKDLQVGEYVKYSPTASIGCAVFPKDANDFEGLYKAADKALYKAKERGKNQLAFYGDDK